MKKAIFAGSFDPITIGHENIVKRAANLFDEIVIAIGNNGAKEYYFSVKKRKYLVEKTFAAYSKTRVMVYDKLTVEFCQEIEAQYIIRGIRNNLDFEYEKTIAQNNKKLAAEIETLFLMTAPEHSHISSTVLRDILRHNGDFMSFVPTTLNISDFT